MTARPRKEGHETPAAAPLRQGRVAGRGLIAASLGAALATMIAAPVLADGYLSAGRSWSGSYSHSTAVEKSYRLNVMDTQKKLEEGYYDNIGSTTTNYYYDSSVGAVNVTADPGSTVDMEVRTADGTGNTTTSTSIGASNTTNTEVNIDGSGNTVGVDSYADSTGCQDGSIQVSSSVVNGVDISAATSSSSSTSGGGNSC
ncbi:MAG: hypothetical protein ABNH26_03935 [Celeribacter sp.]